jgi:hypothetical protein
MIPNNNLTINLYELRTGKEKILGCNYQKNFYFCR